MTESLVIFGRTMHATDIIVLAMFVFVMIAGWISRI